MAALEIPRVDFSGLAMGSCGTEKWAAVRDQVMHAMEAFGCFEAAYEQVSPELHDAVYGRNMEETFALPVDVKNRNFSDCRLQGYISHGVGYQSTSINDVTCLADVQAFANLMWPEGAGNPSYCDAVWAFVEKMRELEQMVRRMLMESLGVDKYFDDFNRTTNYSIRLAKYKAPEDARVADGGAKDSYLPAHVDPNMVTIVGQNEVDGLEIMSKNGDWIPVKPTRGSFVVMVGQSFEAWSNGSVRGLLHRVSVGGDVDRYSTIFVSAPANEVRAPDELVDDEHPRRFRAFDFEEFKNLSITERGVKSKHFLSEFFGVEVGMQMN